MFHCIFTIDYEIHGNGDGCPSKLMVEPTSRMLNIFEKYGAKLCIMADIAEILKFKEYKEKYGEDKYHYQAIIKQLKHAVTNGHDVQLHLHSGYFNSVFTKNRIQQNWDEYDLAKQPYKLIFERIKSCKTFLEQQLREVKPDYSCVAFRAANWSMTPTSNIYKALVDNQILYDTSVFKWGKRSGRVKFDYSNAYSNIFPWEADDKDICIKKNGAPLIEIPIYTEKKYFFAFITPIRIFRMWRAQFHKHEKHSQSSVINKNSLIRKIFRKIHSVFSSLFIKHAWKLDINQATANQQIRALKRISNNKQYYNKNIPVVFIGHSKSFIKKNEKNLKKVLSFIQKNEDFSFSTFLDINKKRIL